MPKTLVQAKISDELNEWFNENFAFGSKQSFIEGCFVSLRESVESGKLPTPKVYTEKAVRGALEGGEGEKE